MRVRTLEQPKLTGKIWDNELFKLTDHRRGDCHSEILDNIVEGDIHINAMGTEYTCIMTHTVKEDNDWIDDREAGQNWMVYVQPNKTDGTIHRGQATKVFVFQYCGWDVQGGY